MTTLRQIIRSLTRTPWYSGTVIGVVALGMALLTTVFAVVDGVLFKPLGYPDADALFSIRPLATGIPAGRQAPMSADDIRTWAAAIPEAKLTGFGVRLLAGEEINESATGSARIQPNFFDVIGVRPLMGGFAQDDFDKATPLVPVVVSYDDWQNRFHGDPQIIGHTVVTDPVRMRGYRVTGVMPPAFVFPSDRAAVRLIMPYVRGAAGLGQDFTDVVARLPHSIGGGELRARVEAAMAAASRSVRPPVAARGPEVTWDAFSHAEVRPLARSLGAQTRSLFGAVFLAGLILVAVGALNASGLMAARALDRAHELAVRRALGATAVTIGRLVFLESLVLIAVGISAGLALAGPLLHLGLPLLPSEIVLLKPVSIDARVVMAGAFSAVVLAVLTTIWPIRQALGGGRGLLHGRQTTPRSRSLGRVLVIATQIAGAFVLAVAGALLVGSILAVYAHALPIQTDDILTIECQVMGLGTAGGMAESPERTARVAAVIARLRAIPGVTAVAGTAAELLDGGSWPSWFRRPADAARSSIDVDVQAVTADYYRIVQPQLVAGRFPTDVELAHDERVVLVSTGLARVYWPQGSALGQTLMKGGSAGSTAEAFTVIGIVKDVRWWSWDSEVGSIYGPYALLARSPIPTLFLQTKGQVPGVVSEALRVIRQADPLMRPRRVAMLKDLFVDSVRPRRFQAWLFGSFASAALVVIGVGMFGLLAMAAARRTREIGIRMALGATKARVVRWLLTEQFPAVLAGLAGGALLSLWAVKFLRLYLYEITAHDARVWGVAAALIGVTATIGAMVPAVQASRTDPVKALRIE